MSVDIKKKPSFNKPLGGGVTFQVNGRELPAKDLMDRAREAVSDNPEAEGLKINAIDVYVKPEENMIYYVARHGKGEVKGSFILQG